MKYPFYLLLLLCRASLLAGQQLPAEGQDYLNANAVTLSRDSNYAHPNWSALKPVLQGKQVVLLGELNHGAATIFEVRNSLIDYLNRELGFSVILFESGFGELAALNLNKNRYSPEELTTGFFGAWRNKPFRELMAIVKARNIEVGGFDVQRTGSGFAAWLKTKCEALAIAPDHFETLEETYGQLAAALVNRTAQYDSLAPPVQNLVRRYQGLARLLEKETALESCLIRQTLVNRVTYLQYMLAFVQNKNWHQRWAARDAAMAANINWLCTYVYPNQPVLIVGHNYHIAKYNEKETVMGALLHNRFGDRMYALGSFVGKGSYADNAGRHKALLAPDPLGLDIKTIIAALPGSLNFINIAQATGSWLNQSVTVSDSFINLLNETKMVLPNYFDGLLLLETSNPPDR